MPVIVPATLGPSRIHGSKSTQLLTSSPAPRLNSPPAARSSEASRGPLSSPQKLFCASIRLLASGQSSLVTPLPPLAKMELSVMCGAEPLLARMPSPRFMTIALLLIIAFEPLISSMPMALLSEMRLFRIETLALSSFSAEDADAPPNSIMHPSSTELVDIA